MSRASIPPLGKNPFLGKQIAPLNRAVEELNELSYISGDSPFQRGPIGSYIQDQRPYQAPLEFDAVIVNAGPNGEADFTNSRYWFQSVNVAQDAFATATDIATPYVFGADYWTVGTYLAEVPAGTHSLTAITPVRVGESTNANGTARSLAALPTNATLVKVKLIDTAKINGSESDPANWVYSIELLVPPTQTSTLNVQVSRVQLTQPLTASYALLAASGSTLTLSTAGTYLLNASLGFAGSFSINNPFGSCGLDIAAEFCGDIVGSSNTTTFVSHVPYTGALLVKYPETSNTSTSTLPIGHLADAMLFNATGGEMIGILAKYSLSNVSNSTVNISATALVLTATRIS